MASSQGFWTSQVVSRAKRWSHNLFEKQVKTKYTQKHLETGASPATGCHTAGGAQSQDDEEGWPALLLKSKMEEKSQVHTGH